MRSIPVLLVVGLALLGLTGCFPDEAPVVPDPLPSSTPVFASEEEALAAAEEAYREYLAVSNAVLSQGGVNPERLLEVADPELYADELEGIQDFNRKGWHSEGETTVDSVSLQMYDATATDRDPMVVVYACLDVSATDVLDEDGNSVVASDRPDRVAFETSFIYDPTSSTKLIMLAKDVWTGDDFCN